MATLELTQLHCHRKQDVVGKDEPRLVVGDSIVWNGAVEKNSTTNLRPTKVKFEDYTKVKLYEMNNKDAKQIGDEAVIREHGNPNTVHFKTAGAWYELYFKVS